MSERILLKADGKEIPAVLNDTVAARDFKKRLPFTVSGYKSDVDFCCIAASGIFDPSETQFDWENGDISLAGGWLSIFFDGGEQSENYRGMMIIAHIDEKYLPIVKNLPDTVRFKIELA